MPDIVRSEAGLTRRLRDALPASVQIVATDLNPDMFEFAKPKFKKDEQVDWKQDIHGTTTIKFEVLSNGSIPIASVQVDKTSGNLQLDSLTAILGATGLRLSVRPSDRAALSHK
mgnify:CR=1 FL=1